MEAPGYRVFVGGISWKADETQLGSFFSTHGQVLECKIIMDKATGKSKGYGFVTFKDADAAEFVKQTANFNFLGKNMNVGDAVRKTPELNGANHNGSGRGNYNGYGYQPFYNNSNNYYRNDTQFYGSYSPDGTFYPGTGPYYYQQGFRGGNQPYQYGGPNFSSGSFPPTNFEEQQPSSPESPPATQPYPQNGFSQFPNFNPYYYNPYYSYPYNGGYAYGPGFNNGGFNNETGEPADPSAVPLDSSQAPQGKLDANNVHTLVNTPSSTNSTSPSSTQEPAQPETTSTQPAINTDSSTSTQGLVAPSSTSTSLDTTSLISTAPSSTSASSTSSASAFEQGSSTFTRSPSKGYANTGIASPKQGVQQRSSPKPQLQQLQLQPQPQQQLPKPKQQPQLQQHKVHRSAPQDPALHNHVIVGLSKLSVSSN